MCLRKTWQLCRGDRLHQAGQACGLHRRDELPRAVAIARGRYLTQKAGAPLPVTRADLTLPQLVHLRNEPRRPHTGQEAEAVADHRVPVQLEAVLKLAIGGLQHGQRALACLLNHGIRLDVLFEVQVLLCHATISLHPVLPCLSTSPPQATAPCTRGSRPPDCR